MMKPTRHVPRRLYTLARIYCSGGSSSTCIGPGASTGRRSGESSSGSSAARRSLDLRVQAPQVSCVAVEEKVCAGAEHRRGPLVVLVTVLQASLQYAWQMETYIADADNAGDAELAEWFRKIQHKNVKAGDQGKRLLAARLEQEETSEATR